MLDEYQKLVSKISKEDLDALQDAESIDEIKNYLNEHGYGEQLGNDLEREIKNMKPNFIKGILKAFMCLVSIVMTIIGIGFCMIFANVTEPATAKVVGYDERVESRTKGSHNYKEYHYTPIVQFEVNGQTVEYKYRSYSGISIKEKYKLDNTYNIKYDLSDPSYFEFEGASTKTLGIIFIISGIILFLLHSGIIRKCIKKIKGE